MKNDAYTHFDEADKETAYVAADYAMRLRLAVFPTYVWGAKAQDDRTGDKKLDGMATYHAFLANPGCSIGIKTGPASGLTALNVFTLDSSSGIHALINAGHVCPKCDVILRCETFDNGKPEGRFHVVLMYTGNETFMGGATAFAGVSVEPSGSVITLPPSRFSCPFDNDIVTVTSYECPEDGYIEGILGMGDELKRIIRTGERAILEQQARPAARPRVKTTLFDPVEEGGRNNELTRRAGYLIGTKRLSYHEALEALLVINRECCKPPLPDREVVTIANSITKRNARHG